jgi:hypothetical protein
MTISADDLHIIGSHQTHEPLSEHAFRVHIIEKLGNLHESVEGIAPPATEEAMKRAFSAALHEFIESDRTWEKCSEKVSALAQKQVGSWLVGGLKTALKRLFWLGIGALVIWHYFGWPGLVSFFKGSSAP